MKTEIGSSKSKRHPSYGDLALDDLKKTFHLTITRPLLFEQIIPLEPSQWLRDVLKAGFAMSVVSEKARSEFLVAPILLCIQERHQGQISIYSGVKFDVEPERGLRGVCDFILSASPMLPTVQSPVFVMVEAKKNDIEEGLGQCVGEMIAAQLFNQREQHTLPSIYGCVTTGENWQFLRLRETLLEIDAQRYFLVNVPDILGILEAIVRESLAVANLFDESSPIR